MAVRDPSDTPTEDFVPDFDDDLPDEGSSDPDVSAESAESSDDPGPAQDGAPGDGMPGGSAPGTNSDRAADLTPEPEPVGESQRGEDQPSGPSQHGGVTNPQAAPVADPAGAGDPPVAFSDPVRHAAPADPPGPPLRTSVPAVSGSGAADKGTADKGGGVPGRSTDWRRAALIALLVLCTTVAGVLTGYAVVRATAGWTVTWGGNDQVAVQPPAREPSPSPTRDRIDRPQQPWPTLTASPTPSGSAVTSEPSRSAQPSRSPKPRTTPTPVIPAPSSPPPPTAGPTASGTGDASD